MSPRDKIFNTQLSCLRNNGGVSVLAISKIHEVWYLATTYHVLHSMIIGRHHVNISPTLSMHINFPGQPNPSLTEMKVIL